MISVTIIIVCIIKSIIASSHGSYALNFHDVSVLHRELGGPSQLVRPVDEATVLV